jgi:hypothetical protein
MPGFAMLSAMRFQKNPVSTIDVDSKTTTLVSKSIFTKKNLKMAPKLQEASQLSRPFYNFLPFFTQRKTEYSPPPLPPAGRTLFEKRVLHSQKLLVKNI